MARNTKNTKNPMMPYTTSTAGPREGDRSSGSHEQTGADRSADRDQLDLTVGKLAMQVRDSVVGYQRSGGRHGSNPYLPTRTS